MADTLVEGVSLSLTSLGGSAASTPNWTLSAIIGAANWGLPGTLIPFSNTSQLYDGLGTGALTSSGATPGSDLLREATDFLNTAGMDGNTLVPNCVGVRVTDTTDVAAVLDVVDTTSVTPAVIAMLTGRCTGSRANGASYSLSASFNSATLKPLYDLTITMPYGLTQTWQGIVAWKITSGTAAYDEPTFAANLVSAVNNGLGQTAASYYFIATIGGSLGTALPLLNTVVGPTTLGTDGATSITTTMLVGTASVSGNTGLQALQGSGVFQFIIAGMIDSTADAAVATLAQTQKSAGLTAVPSGTTTAAAISTYLPIASVYLGKCMDWLIVDATGVKHSPLGTILGIIAQTPPWDSPANKPRTGLDNVVATEKTQKGAISGPEMSQRQGAGILYITNQMPRGGKLMGLPHGQNTSGIQYQDDFQYTRLTNYLEQLIQGCLGGLVGEDQGTTNTDPLRAAAVAQIEGVLQPLEQNGFIGTPDVLDDLTNNSPTTIGQGENFAAVAVPYNSAVRNFYVGLSAGGNVVVTSQAA